MFVYRAITPYHLLQILLIAEKEKSNKLYLEGNSIKKFKRGLIECGWFDQVIEVEELSSKSFLERWLLTFGYILIYALRSFYFRRHTIVTPAHNINSFRISEYSRWSNVMILCEGVQDANILTASGKYNPIYDNSWRGKVKTIASSYFLSIHRKLKVTVIQCQSGSNSNEVNALIESSKVDLLRLDLDEMLSSSCEDFKACGIKVFGNYKKYFVNGSRKRLLIFTQPIYLYSELKFQSFIKKLVSFITSIDQSEFHVFIKLHPRDNILKYPQLYDQNLIDEPIVIPAEVPFEYVSSFASFDVAVGPKSTLMKSNCIRSRVILDEF